MVEKHPYIDKYRVGAWVLSLLLAIGGQVVRNGYNKGEIRGKIPEIIAHNGHDFLTALVLSYPLSIITNISPLPLGIVSVSVWGVLQEVYQCTPKSQRITEIKLFEGVCDKNDYIAAILGIIPVWFVELYLKKRNGRNNRIKVSS